MSRGWGFFTIPFQPEWNDHFIPTGMECHSTPNLKKYASWMHISSKNGISFGVKDDHFNQAEMI